MQILQETGLAQLIALGVPFLALLTVMAIAVRQISKRRTKRQTALTGRYGVDLPQARSPKSSPVAKSVPATEPAKAAKPLDAREIATRIAAAESRSAEAELSSLYLALARDRLANARGEEGGELLRKSIRLAAKLGQKQVHGGARLELGDLLREQGDLTTACEHWQIARGLFHELQMEGELAAAEKRMRQNGCPTDWVLNDF